MYATCLLQLLLLIRSVQLVPFSFLSWWRSVHFVHYKFKMRAKSIRNIWTQTKWEVEFRNTNFPSEWALTHSAMAEPTAQLLMCQLLPRAQLTESHECRIPIKLKPTLWPQLELLYDTVNITLYACVREKDFCDLWWRQLQHKTLYH